jgi:siderophore ferric iron reductase
MLRSVGLLSRLQDEVNELIPECAIHIGCEAPAWDEVSAVNIERLQEYLRLRYPEAGARYWRARGWGLLIWQPIYLAVIAAHKCQMRLPLNEMGQDFAITGIPSGVLFRRAEFNHGQLEGCAQRMAEELIRGCRNVYSSWCVSGLTQKNAERVIADCVLSALLMVYPGRVDNLEELGNLWLAAMGLQGAAGFIRYKNGAGEPRLALDKKTCCFRYLCHGRTPCDVCPRQTLVERLQRLRQASA